MDGFHSSGLRCVSCYNSFNLFGKFFNFDKGNASHGEKSTIKLINVHIWENENRTETSGKVTINE